MKEEVLRFLWASAAALGSFGLLGVWLGKEPPPWVGVAILGVFLIFAALMGQDTPTVEEQVPSEDG